jgi:hypothetical protein
MEAHITLNPQHVTGKEMSQLRPVDKDTVVFCQQCYIPLRGTVVKRLRSMAGERKVTNGR